MKSQFLQYIDTHRVYGDTVVYSEYVDEMSTNWEVIRRLLLPISEDYDANVVSGRDRIPVPSIPRQLDLAVVPEHSEDSPMLLRYARLGEITVGDFKNHSNKKMSVTQEDNEVVQESFKVFPTLLKPDDRRSEIYDTIGQERLFEYISSESLLAIAGLEVRLKTTQDSLKNRMQLVLFTPQNLGAFARITLGNSMFISKREANNLPNAVALEALYRAQQGAF